jgi:hypothetical protein
LASDAELGVKLRETIAVGGDSGRQELERDRLVERQVVGAVNLAHSAAAEKRDEAVASGDDRAGSERN